MKVLEIAFENYRNLKNTKIKPHDGVNVIFGDNAQGKTNFLEAIWIFTAGRSFRSVKDSDLVNFNATSAKVNLTLLTQNRKQDLEIEIKERKRHIKINQIPQASPSSMLGKLRAVVFSPIHLSLIKDGPAIRRKFLDITLCQLKPTYSRILMTYNHVLAQRNILLKNIRKNPSLTETLEIWDDKLADLGSQIIAQREKYLQSFKEIAALEYKGISNGKEILDLEYKSSVHKDFSDDLVLIKEKFLQKLSQNRNSDILAGITTIGAHRDDLEIKIDGQKARLFSSQGQQRSAVLALKLAETTILEKNSGESPIVLLDDVMSELDAKRQDYVLNSIKNRQVFITCCEPTTTLKLKKGACFEVKSGEIFN